MTESRDTGAARALESTSTERRVVLKFGGTSVSTVDRWQTIADAVEERMAEGLRPLLVCSALSQVSNRLEVLLDDVENGREFADGLGALRATHRQLAEAMGVDGEEHLGADLAMLERLLTGASLTSEVTPRLRARVMSLGEVLSTRLGAAWLARRGIETAWLDARELLEAEPVPPTSRTWLERQYLSATCSFEFDRALDARLRDVPARALVTQGFIARGPNDDTVLLGRGGSDTSAAYLAARSGAERLEIWTDVPGLFTANPSRIRHARLLRHVGYAEAGELAARGAKVLHPRCLAPVRARSIPLHLRCTPRPELEGTVIGDDPAGRAPGIKGVVARERMITLKVDVEEQWQRVGLIAAFGSALARHGISIDMVSSSMNHLTAVVDPAANRLTTAVIEGLRNDLAEIGEPHVISGTAAVSVVGTGIGDLLDQLAPFLQLFAHENVHLISHAANDRSLTVVVDETECDRLVQQLHDRLFAAGHAANGSLGPTWEEMQALPDPAQAPAESAPPADA